MPMTLDEQLAGKTFDKTRFGAIADELGIKAHSPQAKGRIERVWGTLLDRLSTYFKLNGIPTMEQFNVLAPQIMDWFNRHFAVKHEHTTDAANQRSDGCFSFQNITFEIDSDKAITKKRLFLCSVNG